MFIYKNNRGKLQLVNISTITDVNSEDEESLHEHIIQIIPAIDWEFVFYNTPDDVFFFPVIAWGLTATGGIIPLGPQGKESGEIYARETIQRFLVRELMRAVTAAWKIGLRRNPKSLDSCPISIYKLIY